MPGLRIITAYRPHKQMYLRANVPLYQKHRAFIISTGSLGGGWGWGLFTLKHYDKDLLLLLKGWKVQE